jgi:hypothetical protein
MRIDYVVYYDQSRFARSGPMHFGSLAERLDEAGIDLAETDGFLEDPAMAPIVRTVKAVMSQQHAQAIADNSARSVLFPPAMDSQSDTSVDTKSSAGDHRFAPKRRKPR